MVALRRRQIRPKQAEEIVHRCSDLFSVEVSSIDRAEIIELDGMELLAVNDSPLILMDRDEDVYVPFITAVGDLVSCASVVVDMGAVPHVVNGADVMIPGIVESEDFDEGAIVCVKTEEYKKVIAVGPALVPSDRIDRADRGKGIGNFHYVGDRYWDAVNELFPGQ